MADQHFACGKCGYAWQLSIETPPDVHTAGTEVAPILYTHRQHLCTCPDCLTSLEKTPEKKA